jgi:hypothetical protein
MHVIDANANDLYKIEPNELQHLYETGAIVNAKNYLENLFNMYKAVQSILTKLPPKRKTEIYDQIRSKLEMPWEWYAKMHAIAYPNIQGEYELTDKMVHLRVELLLAKTLLVYERLDKFYE